MRLFSFFLVGMFFGVVMTKSEAISWFRILEMFRFESFHMYGIIGVAVALSAAILWFAKSKKVRTIDGKEVSYTPMEFNIQRHLLAGSIFGLGWALIGACPGPIYVLLGQGYSIFIVVLISAVIGAFTYGATRKYLPH